MIGVGLFSLSAMYIRYEYKIIDPTTLDNIIDPEDGFIIIDPSRE